MNTWQQVRIGDVLTKTDDWAEIVSGQNYKQVTVRLWGKGVVLRNEVEGSKIAAKRRRFVQPGQFILSRIDARNGAFGLVPDELDGAVVSNDFPSFEIDRKLLLPNYLNWMSKTRDFVTLCQAASEGTTNRVRLQEDRFLAMTIPLPPLVEQQRIVARIDTLATRIEEAKGLRAETMVEVEALAGSAARQLLSQIQAQATTLMQWLDSDRQGIQTGPFGAQLGSDDFIESGIPVITIGNVQYSGLELGALRYVTQQKAEQLSRYDVQEGDILFARMGTVGRCCVVPDWASNWLYNYHLIRVVLDKSAVLPQYVHWSIRASSDVEEYLNETIRGATRQGVNQKIVGGLPIRVPPIDDQHRIVAYLDDLQAKVDAVKRLQAETQAELAALLPSVLDRAFRGEL